MTKWRLKGGVAATAGKLDPFPLRNEKPYVTGERANKLVATRNRLIVASKREKKKEFCLV